jgi:hypothetical protein
MLPAARPGGRPRKINIRAVLNAIFYLLRTGCQLRLLPLDNAGRHTFISMHVAHCESMDKTALEANTSPEKIKSNYLDLVTKKDAKRFNSPKSVARSYLNGGFRFSLGQRVEAAEI